MATTVATYGTWSLDPEFPVEVIAARVTDATPAGAGSVQRRNVQHSVGVDSVQPTTRTFTLRWRHALESEWLAYVALWEASARGARPLAYTPPDGVEVAVRIVGAPGRKRTSPTASEFSANLEEVTNGPA